ncbi:hypothetical protein D187_005717 [Cystobacter fuscus DSM 2262]|uniref:Uncharacterized protein n=1 Tax=Cystobacter fuscus (strain ATCC 25194 / DSM 2262 / NBRC 100088 / M29) TaxID=1242864 RepID=S9PJR7_CYSF2|nr:hypothetical protein D187_005717 [Cystobacter fuscus DSM 2262]
MHRLQQTDSIIDRYTLLGGAGCRQNHQGDSRCSSNDALTTT